MSVDGRTAAEAQDNKIEEKQHLAHKTGAQAALDPATGMKATGDDRAGPGPDTNPLPPGELPTAGHYGLEAGAVAAAPITTEADVAAQAAEEKSAKDQINDLAKHNIHNQA